MGLSQLALLDNDPWSKGSNHFTRLVKLQSGNTPNTQLDWQLPNSSEITRLLLPVRLTPLSSCLIELHLILCKSKLWITLNTGRAVDIKPILDLPKSHRRTFVGFLLSICAILLLVDIFVVSEPPISLQPILSGYLQEITGAILASLIILWFITSFLPNLNRPTALYQIEPHRLSAEFETLLTEASRWRYTGNFGRYLRGKVLPSLAGRPNIQVSVSIIDPQDKKLCQSHAEYRNSINRIDQGRVYDADIAALEVVVTILHCAWYVANRDVSIDLFLLSMFDPLRIDANDNAMILTVEDRKSPALKLTESHFMYQHFDLQMRFERKQGRKLNLEGFAKRDAIAVIEEDDVTAFLASINMQELCEQLTVGRILKACREAKNPYAD